MIFPVLPNVGEEGKDPSRSLPGFLEAQESSQMNQTPGVGRTEGVCLAGTSLHLRRQMNERRKLGHAESREELKFPNEVSGPNPSSFLIALLVHLRWGEQP